LLPFDNQPLTLEIFLFRLLPIGIVGVTIIYGDYLKFGIPEQIRGIIKKYMLGIQGIVLVSASALIVIGAFYQNFEEAVNTLFVISFRGFYSGVGFLLIYRMWFRTINNIITQSILLLRTYYKEIITLGFVIPMIFGVIGFPITERASLVDYLIPAIAIVSGYLIIVILWHFPKHPYSRGVNTSFSSVLLFWSLVLIMNNFRVDVSNFPSNLGLMIPGALFTFYLGMDTYLWRKELYHVLQQVWAFSRTYYRELVTIIGIGIMAVGPSYLMFIKLNPFDLLPIVSFSFGYALIMFIWRVPKHPNYFRGITTTVSMIVLFWGLFTIGIGYPDYSSFDWWAPIVSFFYVLTSIVISAYLWRIELKRSTIQVGKVLVDIIKGFFEIVGKIVKAVWNAFKQAFWGIVEYVSTNYKEIITVFFLFTMFLAAVGSNDAYKWEPLFLFFLVYLGICTVWRFPTRHEYFRGITTTVSIATLFWGVYLFLKNGVSPLNPLTTPTLITYLLIGTGFLLPSYLWRVELWRVVKQIAQTFKQAFLTSINAVIDFGRASWKIIKQGFWGVLHFGYGVLVFLWANFMTLIEYLQVHAKDIVKTVTTLVGVILVLLGLLGSFGFHFGPLHDTGSGILLIAGIVILYVTWFSQVNEFLNNTARSIYAALIAFGHYLWDSGVAIMDGVVNFLNYVISLWKKILRAGVTIIGVFLIIMGISQFDLFFLGPGVVILYIAWFSQVNEFLNRTARSIYTALIAFGHYLWDSGVAIMEAVVNFFRYIIRQWRGIVRATATIIGALLVSLGSFNILFGPVESIGVNSTLIVLGFILISVSWRSQIKELLIRYAKALSDIIGQLIKTIREISSRIWTQLIQIVRTGFDSSIIIAIVTGILALGYGVILVYCGIFDPDGSTTAGLRYDLPIVGEIIWLIASIVQGVPIESVTNLLGVFVIIDNIIVLILFGAVFIGFGILLPLFSIRKRESIKISTLQRRLGSSTSTNRQLDYETKEGIK
jgi:hypothetical protein